MEHGDKKAEASVPQQARKSPDRTPAWMQLTYEYLRDLPRQLREVIGLLEAQDYTGIKHIAHRAKGTSGTYGLTFIAEKFAQLEQLAESHNSEQIAGLVGAIQHLTEAETAKLGPRIASVDEHGGGGGNG